MQNFSEISDTLYTGRDWLNWCAVQFEGAVLFYGHGTSEAFDEALALVMHIQGIAPADIDIRIDDTINEKNRRKFYDIAVDRIKSRKPLSYLTGEAWFAGLKFKVDERVLVPRSPFAELITRDFRPWLNPASIGKVLDMCTGSGCIAIATAVQMENVIVDAVDISQAALDLANENTQLHGVTNRVRLVWSDGFANLGNNIYDLVLCNPPYVAETEMQALPEEYRYEPALGLEAGDDGLDFVRQFLIDVPQYLSDNGLVFVEVGSSAETMAKAYPDLPLTWIELQRGGDGIFMLSKEDLQALTR
ncbi:MAG: 50S ribosomal protein L3 N(5)-glutamine methyltransferase [Gammaproteobacteria bacterium]